MDDFDGDWAETLLFILFWAAVLTGVLSALLLALALVRVLT